VDTPKVLSSYARRYGVDHANWAFLTGEQEALAPVWKTFGVKVVRKSRGLIDHTPLMAVIDRQGTTRVVYLGTFPDTRIILEDIRRLLRRSWSLVEKWRGVDVPPRFRIVKFSLTRDW
jgi:cytochrome oxidase Cu insertion factor (SCO1/SenC/PrrC family)